MALFLSQICKPRDSSKLTRFSEDSNRFVKGIRFFLARKIRKVDFFDIFIFNNVKSDLKIILNQSNKVVFMVKVLPL